MTGLDTNVLVRYLAQDDAEQSPKATRLIDPRLSLESPGFVSLIAIAEVAWVLGSIYALSNQELSRAIERVLQADTLVVQNEQEVFTAMIALKNDVASFGDALIAALGSWAGCESTMTFDKNASRLKDFRLL